MTERILFRFWNFGNWNLFVIWCLGFGAFHHRYALCSLLYAKLSYSADTPEKLNPSILIAGATVPVTKRLE